MSEEGLQPVKTKFPVVSSQMVVAKLTDAYHKIHEVFPDIRINFDESGFDNYRVSIDAWSLEDAYRIAALLSDAATLAVESIVVPDDSFANVPLKYYLKRIPVTTGDAPEVKWRLVDASPIPKKIIYSGPATIVLWADGTKTVVKCAKHDTWDFQAGFLWALAEKVYGNRSQVEKVISQHANFIHQ